MDKNNVAGGRAYEEEEGEELDPAVEWKQAGEEQDVVEIRLPGFRKEHVRVQVDNYGVLRVTGGRPARGGRWVRFTKDLRLPDGCDADGVRARFEDDRLLITLPIVPAAAGDAASPTTPSPEPLPRTSSFQPPSSAPPPRLPPPPGKPNFFEPKLRPPLLQPRPPPPPAPPVKPTSLEPKFRPPPPPPRDPISRPLPPFPTKHLPVIEPKSKPPPPPPQPPAKPTAFEPKHRPSLTLPREPSSRPLPPFPAKPSTAFEPKTPSPPKVPAPASLFPSRPPPSRATSTSFVPKPPPPPPPPRLPSRLPSFPKPPPARAPSRLPSFPPPPPPAKPTFFDSKHWLPGRHTGQAPDNAPQPTTAERNPAAAERKPWAPPSIVPGPRTALPERMPSPPPFPPRKQSTANVPDPKSRTLPDIPKSPTLSDITIAMSSPSPASPPPPPPPRRRLPGATDKTKNQGNAQEGAEMVRLPLLEEMKKKEKKKMEGRKAREAGNVGNATPPAVIERREVSPNLLTPASRDPISTTELVANMAAAAAVLVGIAVSVWHTMSGSS